MNYEAFLHPQVKGVYQKDVTQHIYNLDEDPVIPGVLGCVVTEYKYKIWNGSIKNKGLCLLMLRRGDELDEVSDVWSVVAGLRDCVPVQFWNMTICSEKLALLNVIDEIIDETGFHPRFFNNIFQIGSYVQGGAKHAWQTFCLQVYFAQLHANITPLVRLNYENTGRLWVRVESILEYVKTGKTTDRDLHIIFKDGTADNVIPVWSMLRDYYFSRYRLS